VLNENDDLSWLPDETAAAMRDLARTVTGAPPLRLAEAVDLAPDAGSAPGAKAAPASDAAPPRRRGPRLPGARRPGGPRRPRRAGPLRRSPWSVLAPVAAAVTVVAVAVSLVLVRGIPSGLVAAPASSSSSASTGPTDMPVPAGLPGYYAAWVRTDAGTPSLLVGDTITGRVIAQVTVPRVMVLTGVFGTASNDSTFVVTAGRLNNLIQGPETIWYLLTVAPDGSGHARLTPLPTQAPQSPAGVALSPDASKLAVALPGSPATLRVYATATGRLLRAWSTTAPGQIAAEKPQPNSTGLPAMSLRWSADGRQLAFTWNAADIRVLSATAPDGNLISASKPLASIGTGYGLDGASYTCDAARGWTLIDGGQGTICAGGLEMYSPSCADGTCTQVRQVFAGFLREAPYGQGGSETEVLDRVSGCSDQPQPGEGAYLDWANADGSVLIGSFVCDKQSRFGAFRGNGFAPLPALPASPPLSSGVPYGTVAW
jgi:hypothetical protein